MKINSRNSPDFAQAKWDAFVASYAGPYDFSESVYAGMNRKITFKCPDHGYVTSDAKNLMQGKKCFKCAVAARTPRITQAKAITRFRLAHGDRYDYSQVAYKNQTTPVQIACSKHGEFMQMPEYHWNGSGCPQCYHEDRRGSGQRDTKESFLRKVTKIFGSLFEFPGLEYSNSQADLQVFCTRHKTVSKSRPNWMVNGQNPCAKCNHMKSAGEDQVATFLAAFTPVVRRDRSIIGPLELDMYLPEKQIAVEYCGMYWHATKNVEDEKTNKLKHYNKHMACAAKGIRLITIYESEWQERRKQTIRLLRNAIGASKGKLMARKCSLRSVEPPEATAFFDMYHPQGGAGYGVHYGLYWKNKLVACMRFTFGINDRGHSARQWTLARYATRINVVGGASRLFKAFLLGHQYPTVKSFSDNRYFSGAMYEQLGFILEEDCKPDYQVWSPKIGLRPKAHYQRRHIPQRISEHKIDLEFDPKADNRTEREMTYLLGCGRIYDCGKKRWAWTS